MNKQRVGVFLATLVTALGLAGCATAPLLKVGEPWRDTAVAKSLCEALVSKSSQVRSFRALLEAKVSVAEDESYAFRYAIAGSALADRDVEAFRVDLLPMEGVFTLGLISVLGDQATMIDSQDKRYFVGCRPDRLFERFFGLKGITEEIVRALVVGKVAPIKCDSVELYSGSANETIILDSVNHRAWVVDRDSGELLGVNILDSSNKSIYATAERRILGGRGFIQISIYKPVKANAEMKVVKFSANPKIDDGLFVVASPSGYEREECP